MTACILLSPAICAVSFLYALFSFHPRSLMRFFTFTHKHFTSLAYSFLFLYMSLSQSHYLDEHDCVAATRTSIKLGWCSAPDKFINTFWKWIFLFQLRVEVGGVGKRRCDWKNDSKKTNSVRSDTICKENVSKVSRRDRLYRNIDYRLDKAAEKLSAKSS